MRKVKTRLIAKVAISYLLVNIARLIF